VKTIYKVILIITVLFVSISITFLYFLKTQDKPTSSIACGRVFTSIEELDSNCEIILKGTVKPKEGEIKLGLKYEQYPIEIIEVIKNTSEKQLNEKGEILLVSSKIMDIDTIEAGEYLLFLNPLEIEDKQYYVNNSINNLYKLKNRKYVNVFGSFLGYITSDDKALYQIKERDIVKLREKYIENN